MTTYCHIAELKSVFKVQEDCCIIRVIYEGEVKILPKNDHVGDNLNSDDLICPSCNFEYEIQSISELQFLAYYDDVYAKLYAKSSIQNN
jgi:hypothetical protein